MRQPIESNNKPMLLALTLKATGQPVPIRIRVSNAYMPNSSYTDREGMLTGQKTFYVRMPRTGKYLVADVVAKGAKLAITEKDPGFSLVKHEILTLPTFPETYNNSHLVKCAVAFVEEFSAKAGILGAGLDGSVYTSNCGNFRIDYLDVIRDRKTGRELSTPARISQDRGIIEVSKKYFLQYAIPHRVAILLHEISHFYLNRERDSEQEADLNSLKIFLGRGYGPIDAENAFLNVFKNADTPENRARYEKLHAYILDFDAKYNTYR